MLSFKLLQRESGPLNENPTHFYMVYWITILKAFAQNISRDNTQRFQAINDVWRVANAF